MNKHIIHDNLSTTDDIHKMTTIRGDVIFGHLFGDSYVNLLIYRF
jgi:hypothetical protein